MATTIRWRPSTDSDIHHYVLSASGAATGPFVVVATIQHDLTGTNYDPVSQQFFYEHVEGNASTWYTLVAVDSIGNESPTSAPFTPSLVAQETLASLDDLKRYLGITHTNDDLLLTQLLQSASKWFESQVGRPILTSLYIEKRHGDGGKVLVPRHCPVQSVNSLTVDGQDVSYTRVGDVLYTDSTLSLGTANVVLSYVAGYAEVPHDIRQAVLWIAASAYRERTRIGEMSKTVAGESVSFAVFQVPANVRTVLDSYTRVPGL